LRLSLGWDYFFSGDSMPIRYDSGTIKGKADVGDDGAIRTFGVVTRTGVFYYQNPDGTIRRELRHPDEVFSAESLRSMQLIPVTVGHRAPKITVDNAKEFQVGTVGERIEPDGKNVIAPIVISHRDGINALEIGIRQLSLGYEAEMLEEGGTYDGQPYEYKQTNIRYNHLAIVETARAGSDARIYLDSADAFEITETEINNNQTEGSNMPKVRLDGIEYEAAQEVINSLNKANENLSHLQTRLDSMKEVDVGGVKHLSESAVIAALEKERGEKDAIKVKLDESEKRSGAEAISAAVNARVKVLNAGNRVLDKNTVLKLDSMDSANIMKLVISECTPEALRADLKTKLDSASPDYLEARFDAACVGMPDPNSKIAGTRFDARTTVDGVVDKTEAARNKMIADAKGEKESK